MNDIETHGKYTFRVIKQPDFFKWIARNYGNTNNFMALKPKDKEVIFLRWKWGLSDIVNESLENTRQALMHSLGNAQGEDVVGENRVFRWYREMLSDFEDKCKEIKRAIGLIYDKEDLGDPMVENIMGMFDGERQG